MKSDIIAELREMLLKDAKSKHPKYPQQSAFALKDKRVAEAVKLRLDNGASLTGIEILEYDFFSGLNRIYFEFSPHEKVCLKPSAILVILDGMCNVVGYVDPFDPVQPNPAVPPLPVKSSLPPKGTSLPFALDRPSGATEQPFSQKDLYMLQVRNSNFLNELGLGDLGGFDEGSCDSPACTVKCAMVLSGGGFYDETVETTDITNDDVSTLE